jgi:DNA mismatch repair protein MSH5
LNIETPFGSYVLDSRPSSEFQYEGAKSKLVNLGPSANDNPQLLFTTPGDNAIRSGANMDEVDEIFNVGHQGRLLRLAGCIDLESRITVGQYLS